MAADTLVRPFRPSFQRTSKPQTQSPQSDNVFAEKSRNANIPQRITVQPVKFMDVIRIQRKQNVNTVSDLYSELVDLAPKCAIQVPTDLDEYRLSGKGEL